MKILTSVGFEVVFVGLSKVKAENERQVFNEACY